jgi:hypothetical protein
MKQKETGVYPMGWDPVTAEQRITAAERGAGPGWKEDITDPLRKEQYGSSTLQNMGDFFKSGYGATLGNVVPFAFLPGGGIWKSQWRNRPNEALPMRRGNIMRGEGTIADKSRASRRGEAEYRHKYYGTPELGPRESNVYDELGMPQPKSNVSHGKRQVPLYLRELGLRAEEELGPYKVPPPGSELGLPAGALITRGLSLPGESYLKKETRDLINSGKVPVENLPPGIQRFIKDKMERPKTFFDLSGGRGADGKEEEGEKKETFNILKFLMGLLGLPLKLLGLDLPGEDEKKKKKTGGPRQPQRQRIPWQAENRMNRQRYTPTHKSGG